MVQHSDHEGNGIPKQLAHLLSHRLRGFPGVEHSRRALERAIRVPVPFLEIDTRVSADGVVYVYHNVQTSSDVGSKLRFSETPSPSLDALRYTTGGSLLTLQEALALFKGRSYQDQKLCIDIKDFGFEEEHLRLVREAGVEDDIVFVSWIPQSLLRLHDLGAPNPLVLSHWNLHAWGKAGALLAHALRDQQLRLHHYVVLGARQVTTDLGNLDHGYQHTLVCRDVPPPIRRILASSGGGICIHRSLVGDAVISYWQDQALQLWIFSVDTAKEYLRYARRPGTDVIFCDDTPAVLEALGKEA